ncbi:SGNH/GDSL hydrolase family protein [Streptomyces sp. NPDC088766]|uniref:SGNH/GDSL hydrolase family protein n=1 Tax=Streptomyces sp. NPDC088766 TaxID=3365893 RepID=UPI0037F190B6
MTHFTNRFSHAYRTAAAIAVAGATVLSLGAPAAIARTQAAASADGPNYVALGDSYASGAGLAGVTDTECDRTTAGYGAVVSRTSAGAGRTFKNVTCSGATTAALWNSQGSKPAQLNALTPNTKLVTLTLGGNDVGFTGVLTTCVLVASSDPAGSPCKKYFTAGGKDVLGERINAVEGRVRDALTDIRRRSPDAKVIVVGYPAIFPDSGVGCAEVPFAKGDFSFLRDVTKKLNRALQRRATAGDRAVRFADTYAVTVGHDMCQPRDTRWIESLNPGKDTLAAHPNSVGQFAMATAAYAEILKP